MSFSTLGACSPTLLHCVLWVGAQMTLLHYVLWVGAQILQSMWWRLLLTAPLPYSSRRGASPSVYKGCRLLLHSAWGTGRGASAT